MKPIFEALKQGKFVLVHDSDDREGETDLVIASQFVNPSSIMRMRKDGGGLIFLMTSYEIAQQLQLPFLADVYKDIEMRYPVVKALEPNDIPYDAKSSFSLYVNHRKTFTGITDNDRSLTMKSFAGVVQKITSNPTTNALEEFGSQFRSPGHVPICVASEQLLAIRQGHTELIIALLQMADLLPVGSGCEMMDGNGKALNKTKAQEYAQDHGYPYVDGKDIIRAWQQWSK
jgi:3,4-dihydroxy 2-butanone 4-phosphate synthase